MRKSTIGPTEEWWLLRQFAHGVEAEDVGFWKRADRVLNTHRVFGRRVREQDYMEWFWLQIDLQVLTLDRHLKATTGPNFPKEFLP